MSNRILISPEGTKIIGTIERIPGVALIANVRETEGGFDFDYEGTTEPNWDGQETVVVMGNMVFQDENGKEWLERELKCVEKEPAL